MATNTCVGKKQEKNETLVLSEIISFLNTILVLSEVISFLVQYTSKTYKKLKSKSFGLPEYNRNHDLNHSGKATKCLKMFETN